MFQRGAQPDLSSTGAFIDTTGERKKNKKREKILVEAAVADEEEKELEALVFGRQLFNKPQTYEYSSEEVNDRKDSFILELI